MKVTSGLLLGTLLGSAFLLPSTQISAVLGFLYCFILSYRIQRQSTLSYTEAFSIGIGLHISVFYWVPEVLQKYGELGFFLTIFLSLLFVILSSLQFMAFAFLLRILDSPKLSKFCLSIPLSWSLLEYWFPRMTPWMIGHTQIAFRPFAQLADLGGVIPLSFLMLWWACTVTSASATSTIRFFAAITFTLSLCYGFSCINTEQAKINLASKLSAALVQGAVAPAHNPSRITIQQTINTYRDLSKTILNEKKVDLLIWPETAVGFDYYADEKFISVNNAKDPYPERQTQLIFGGQLRERTLLNKKLAYYNAAFLLGTDGGLSIIHQKNILIPFIERFPLQNIFPRLAELHRRGFYLLPGTQAKTQQLSNPLTYNIRLGICYEDMWETAFSVDDLGKPGILIAISNDVWFGNSIASKQHHMLATWRAIEQRQFMLRGTNNGVTAIIDSTGLTVGELARFQPSVLYSPQISLLAGNTTFTYIGSKLLRILFSLLLLWAVVRLLYRHFKFQ